MLYPGEGVQGGGGRVDFCLDSGLLQKNRGHVEMIQGNGDVHSMGGLLQACVAGSLE